MSVPYSYDPRDFDNTARDAAPQHYDFKDRSSYRAPPRYQEEARYDSRQPRGFIEESYTRTRARSRGPPEGRGRGDHYDESDADDDEDDDYDVEIRRYRNPRSRSRSRARSLDLSKGVRQIYERDEDGKLVRYDVRRRNLDSDSDFDSEDDQYHSDRGSRKSSKSTNSKALIKPAHPNAKPCSVACPDNANRPPPFRGPRAFNEPDSDSDYNSEDAEKEHRKRRNKRILYGTLAGMATINAGNTLYQNSKGFKNRREAIEKGEMCSAEAKNQKRNMLMEDALAVAVMGIGVNNVVKGWKRNANLKKQDQEIREKWERKRERRDEKYRSDRDGEGSSRDGGRRDRDRRDRDRDRY